MFHAAGRAASAGYFPGRFPAGTFPTARKAASTYPDKYLPSLSLDYTYRTGKILRGTEQHIQQPIRGTINWLFFGWSHKKNIADPLRGDCFLMNLEPVTNISNYLIISCLLAIPIHLYG